MRRPTAPRRRGRWRASMGKGVPSPPSSSVYPARPNLPSRRSSTTRRSPTWSPVSRWQTNTCRPCVMLPTTPFTSARPRCGGWSGLSRRRQRTAAAKAPRTKAPADKSPAAARAPRKAPASRPSRAAIGPSSFCRSTKTGRISSCGTTLMRGAWPGRSGRPGPGPVAWCCRWAMPEIWRRSMRRRPDPANPRR